AASQAEARCRFLQEAGGAATRALLREWAWPTRTSAALREQLGKGGEDFGNNLHRLEDPEDLAEGWQIGSGGVGGAWQTVGGQRLKGAGMRWSEAGAHALCHVRARYRRERGQWDAFCRRHLTNYATGQQLN